MFPRSAPVRWTGIAHYYSRSRGKLWKKGESSGHLQHVKEVRTAARTVASLDRPVGEDGESTLGDLLPSPAPGPDDVVDGWLREAALHRAVHTLPARDRVIVRMRYGIDGEAPRSLKEIGELLELTPERVRQIEAAALARLADAGELAGVSA